MNSRVIYRIRRILESRYPSALAVIAFLGLNYGWPDVMTVERCQKLSWQYLSVFTAFLGFAFASMVTLVCLADKEFLREMKQSGTLQLLLRYHRSCLGWCLLAIGCAVFFQLYAGDDFHPTLAAIFTAAGVGTVAATWRIASLFHKLLKILEFL
ncbi:MAG: hypothetical protein HDQ90_01185 [Desulfovibrio sp.]|nr:hypothetical protein [Desulfovibrio sp.]